jgi:hypothetical protein
VIIQRSILVLVFLGFSFALLTGCASYKPAPASYQPQMARIQRQTNGPIIAEVAVLSRKEAEKKFGLPLHKKNIQPVWLRLVNTSTNDHYFLPAGLDSDYHPASEVAYMHRKFLAGKRNRRVSEVLQSSEMELLVPPTGTNEGFVFSNFDPGAKHVEVDVIGERAYYAMEFTVPVPGKRIDYHKVDFESLYSTNEFTDCSLEAFREVIRSLPSETTDWTGTGRGDPLNLVVVSSLEGEMGLAFLRNGWDVTEVLTFWNGMKLVSSFIFKSRWRTSPVSPLYVFDRRQDFALQKARATIHERNHLRLWLAPYTCEGHHVFVGQISRDIGLRFTFKAPGFVTHKIDPETDEARDYLAQEMILSGSVERVAWAGGVGKHTVDNPGRNLTGDPWHTDGNRVILFLSREPIDPEDVHLLDWTDKKPPAASPNDRDAVPQAESADEQEAHEP